MGKMIKEQEMSSGKITLEQRKASLHYHVQEYRKRRVIIDTDAACEADDPLKCLRSRGYVRNILWQREAWNRAMR